MFEAAERLDPEMDHATWIAYCYSKAVNMKRTDKWSAIAYERSPGSITAYNYALVKERAGEFQAYEQLMEEALSHDPDETSTLNAYGHYLTDKGDPRGMKYINRAFNVLYRELQDRTLDSNDYYRLRRAAKTLGRQNILSEIEHVRREMEREETLFDEDNLVKDQQESNLKVGD
jgi:Tfp pilus assembly protein PilF